jgi:hypothetical protein
MCAFTPARVVIGPGPWRGHPYSLDENGHVITDSHR